MLVPSVFLPRVLNHITADDRPVASRLAEWDEVRAIVNAVGETGKGIFEIAGEAPAGIQSALENTVIGCGIWL